MESKKIVAFKKMIERLKGEKQNLEFCIFAMEGNLRLEEMRELGKK